MINNKKKYFGKLIVAAVAMMLVGIALITIFSSTHNYIIAKQVSIQEKINDNELAQNAYTEVFSYKDLLELYLEDIMAFADEKNVDISITYTEFEKMYYDSGLNIKELVNSIKTSIDNNSTINDLTPSKFSSSSSGDKAPEGWYFNTGTSLPQRPQYGTYAFNKLRKGDILFEEKTMVIGIGGHVAVLEGIFYDNTYSMNYYRMVEAIAEHGVCRGVLDDDRFLNRKGSILRAGATASTSANATDWIINQIGKGYKLDLKKDKSASESDWYCSELVWAGYMSQGIDIEVKNGIFRGLPGIPPIDIKNCHNIGVIGV